MAKPEKTKNRLDYGTLVGLLVGAASLLGGIVMEHGQLADIAQITAAIIVIGGTTGAVLVGTPYYTVWNALKALRLAFFAAQPDLGGVLNEIIGFANQARTGGIVSLEDVAVSHHDPYLRKGLMMVVDGVDINDIRSALEMEIDAYDDRCEKLAKVPDAAGGYAPTIGLIGAVMGLIQVMKNLQNLSEVGRGIAVAFVSTIYGVAVANLFLLPAAQKMRTHGEAELKRMEMIRDGLLAIAEGMNPKLIRERLDAYCREEKGKEPAEDAKTAAVGALSGAEE